MRSTEQPAREFTLDWTLDASPRAVFRAWTEPEHLDWFYHDTMPVPDEPIELDLRVGGAWRQHMAFDEETSYVTGGVYREIVPDKRLVFSWGAVDGWPELDPNRLDDSPLVTVSLEPVSARTRLTLHVELPAQLSDEDVREFWEVPIRDGWREAGDRLSVLLAGTDTTN